MKISVCFLYIFKGASITLSNGLTLVESDYGVEVEWNNVRNVRVTVLGRYLNRTSGLCGTFNRNPGDDFLAMNGTTVNNAVDFGNSWKTDPDCEDAVDIPHPCGANDARNATAIANCSALLSAPFVDCASKIDPESEGYIDDCEYDVCACDDYSTVCLCQAIEAYVTDCAAEGVSISWLSDPRYQQCSKYNHTSLLPKFNISYQNVSGENYSIILYSAIVINHERFSVKFRRLCNTKCGIIHAGHVMKRLASSIL